MKVLVYVEGAADRAALSALLRRLIEDSQDRGIGISFHDQGGKAAILDGVPRRAADHLADRPSDWVIALPDLYPMASYTGRNAHASFADLERLMRTRFEERAAHLGLAAEVRNRFRVHCLKHDLEALLLAARDQLRQRLGTVDALRGVWTQPVENQNDYHPPKRVVEGLFRRYRRKPGYVDTLDAPWILARADLAAVQNACPQRFAPFLADLDAAVALA